MTSILRRPSPSRFDPGLAPPTRKRSGSGLVGLAAMLTLTVLVAAGFDAIAFDGVVMAGIRDRVRPAAARWEGVWRNHRLHP